VLEALVAACVSGLAALPHAASATDGHRHHLSCPVEIPVEALDEGQTRAGITPGELPTSVRVEQPTECSMPIARISPFGLLPTWLMASVYRHPIRPGHGVADRQREPCSESEARHGSPGRPAVTSGGDWMPATGSVLASAAVVRTQAATATAAPLLSLSSCALLSNACRRVSEPCDPALLTVAPAARSTGGTGRSCSGSRWPAPRRSASARRGVPRAR
jgi:hypothetical protein